MKKMLSFVLAALMLCTCLTTAFAGSPVRDRDIVILYTNDVHCGIAEKDSIGYAGLAAYKKSIEKDNHVLLVDAGDSIQGNTIGVVSTGEYLIDIMNYIGYDVAIPGNHEFDYGMKRFLELKDKAQFPYLSCNLTDLRTDSLVLEPYRIIEVDGVRIGFVGITTPETLRSCIPKSFKNDKGEFIYGFHQNDDGTELYRVVQNAVDAVRKEGVQYVIALGHLGVNDDCIPWTSAEVISHTTGIDVLIDGHSHTVMPCEKVKNAEGKEVLCTQTGTKLSSFGQLTISKDGQLSAELISDYTEKDSDTEAYIANIQKEYSEVLGSTIAYSPYDLVIYKPGTEKKVRLVRNRETNLGDLVTDCYRILSEADLCISGGGGMRDDIPAGDISFNDIITVSPYGNSISIFEVTGQQIMDALEFGARSVPKEFGGFLQVSGLSYEIHSYIPSAVTTNENGEFTGYSGEQRRVHNVLINGEPIDLNRTYTSAGTNFLFESYGDGYTMFKGCKPVQYLEVNDFQLLSLYLIYELEGTVPEAYANPNGQGRITVISEEPAK